MTGTNCDLFTHKSSRSYLNHLVLTLRLPHSKNVKLHFPEKGTTFQYTNFILPRKRYQCSCTQHESVWWNAGTAPPPHFMEMSGCLHAPAALTPGKEPPRRKHGQLPPLLPFPLLLLSPHAQFSFKPDLLTFGDSSSNYIVLYIVLYSIFCKFLSL